MLPFPKDPRDPFDFESKGTLLTTAIALIYIIGNAIAFKRKLEGKKEFPGTIEN